jgi:hypothetical protein
MGEHLLHIVAVIVPLQSVGIAESVVNLHKAGFDTGFSHLKKSDDCFSPKLFSLLFGDSLFSFGQPSATFKQPTCNTIFFAEYYLLRLRDLTTLKWPMHECA